MSEYPPIGDYGLIGDCHTAALVSRQGSIDWCCLPRFDSGSSFGRLLDIETGGHCSIAPADPEGWEFTREYLDGTLVLRTTMRSGAGEIRLIDCLACREADSPRILRLLEGIRGSAEFAIEVVPRYDYGQVRPWIRSHGPHLHSAIGGNDGLVIFSDAELAEKPTHQLTGRLTVSGGDRIWLSLTYEQPHRLDPSEPEPGALDKLLERTIKWWRKWTDQITADDPRTADARRSGVVLKALTYAPTGAIIAAPTTSLPEVIGGPRNWDYRYAWVRDASFSARAFAELGAVAEADAFRAFVMRSAAGHAGDLQVVFGAGGERRLTPTEVDGLGGYRGSAPVLSGNGAARQLQLDAFGELVNLTYRWHRRGHSPDDDDWRFLITLIDAAAERWSEPDHGIWEWPGDPQHFVHSKVLCWSALDRGIRLADECLRRAPTRRWRKVRDEIRETVERRGYDRRRGVFVQAFGSRELDSALLLLPTVDFVDWKDERMLRTTEAIREQLAAGEGLLYRYRRRDGLPGREGAFLCCSFWLAECLAQQGEDDQAREVYDRAIAAGNDLGLFSEEVDPATGELLGNFPQGLTHLAQIDAAAALADSELRVLPG